MKLDCSSPYVLPKKPAPYFLCENGSAMHEAGNGKSVQATQWLRLDFTRNVSIALKL